MHRSSCKHEICAQKATSELLKSYSSPAPFAKTPLRGFPLLRSSLLLIERRSLRSFPCTDSHASMESVLSKLRVNCKKIKIKNLKKLLTYWNSFYIIILASRKGQLSGRKSAQAIKSFGVWLSLARAPGLGPGGRRFESCHPDII